MGIEKGFSKGRFSSKKHGCLLHSERIDKRKKENKAYRAGKTRTGLLLANNQGIIWDVKG